MTDLKAHAVTPNKVRRLVGLDIVPVLGLNSARVFLTKYSVLLGIGAGFGLLAGILGASLFSTWYYSNIILESFSEEHAVLEDPLDINNALASAFDQSSVARLYANTFFDHLDKEIKAGATIGANAQAAKTYLVNYFASPIAEGSSGGTIPEDISKEDQAKLGLASYANGVMTTYLRDKKRVPLQGFLYLVSTTSSSKWEATIRVTKRGISGPIARASATALTAAAATYNQSELEKRRRYLKSQTDRAKEVYGNATESFLTSKGHSDKDITQVRIDFFRLEQELLALTGSKLAQAQKYSPGLFIDKNYEDQENLFVNPNVELLDEIRTEKLSRLLAFLSQEKIVSGELLAKYVERLVDLEKTKALVNGARVLAQQSLLPVQQAFASAILVASTPLDTGLFMIASAKYDAALLQAQKATGAVDTVAVRPAIFIVLMTALGFLGAFFICFVHHSRAVNLQQASTRDERI